MTPDSISGATEARRFTGLPESVGRPYELLGALKRARVQLGIPGEVIDLLDCLFGFTEAQDWQEGTRPIVWPSSSFLCHQLGISLSALKKRIRRAMELRLISDKPSPNGKRFGVRAKGLIKLDQTFGFDLSLLAVRHAEFAAAGAQGLAVYQAAKAMQRRGYAAKTGLLQLLETADEQAIWTDYWEQLEERGLGLFPALRVIDQPGQLAHAVHALEALRTEAEGVLLAALVNQTESVTYPVNSDPKGALDAPLYNSTNQLSESTNTCRAPGKSSRGATVPVHHQLPVESEIEERFIPSVVLAAAPEIAANCPAAYPSWNDVADAARVTAAQFGIAQRLWGRACSVLGAHGAALALAVMVHQTGRKPVGSPGGYFHTMIERARRGELDLRRSYYGMRSRLQ